MWSPHSLYGKKLKTYSVAYFVATKNFFFHKKQKSANVTFFWSFGRQLLSQCSDSIIMVCHRTKAKATATHGFWGTMVHEYTFQANKGYFGINLNGQGISLLFKRTLVEKCRGKWNLLNREKRNKKKFSRVWKHIPPSPLPSPLNFRTFWSFLKWINWFNSTVFPQTINSLWLHVQQPHKDLNTLNDHQWDKQHCDKQPQGETNPGRQQWLLCHCNLPAGFRT